MFAEFGDIERGLLGNGNVYNGSIESDFDELGRVAETCAVGTFAIDSVLYIVISC
jgi:hypothetical protein